MAKYSIMPCQQKRRLALFLMVQRMVVVDGWFFAGDRFFFFSSCFSLSPIKKYTPVLFSFCFSILVLKFFIAYFSHWPF